MSTSPTPAVSGPLADRRPRPRIHHGDRFDDPYEWLRDRTNPDVISYLEAENLYTEAKTAHLGQLRADIFDEIKARTKETDLSVPTYASHPGAPEGTPSAYWYYTRTVEGLQYPIRCRVAAADRHSPPDVEAEIAGEEVLLDGNLAAEDHEFFSIGAFAVSVDGTLLGYSTDVTGAERFTVRIKDLRTGELLPDEIEDTAYGLAWAGNSHLFYTRADEAWRPYVVRRHRIGTDAAADADVITETDERFWIGVDASRDDQWIVIGAGSKLTSEFSLLSASDPEGVPRMVAPRRQGVEYDVEPAGDRLLIVHNDGAEDFALAQAPLDATSHEQWTPVIRHELGVRLTGVAAYSGHAVVSLRRNGLTGLHVLPRDADGNFGTGSDIEFDEPLFTAESPGGADYDAPSIRIGYGSMLTPDSVYDYDLSTQTLTLLKRSPVLDHPVHGPYQPDSYVQERGWATASDGTQIPLSIVYHRDVALDGSAPALLYGYGSYEIPIDPAFAISRLSLLDRGFVFAVAHVRGGGELGRSWYENGKALSKKNTFTDFVACAEWLVDQRYTSSDRLAARGGSAGGLLMGAAANLAPQAFRAIHADVPFVDALTTILDPSLPLTVIEWEEWGDPLHDPQIYAYMKGYSPYENLRRVEYPSILATTSLNDTRVFYVEPAKWVAALRRVALNSDDKPILLKTEMVAGHGGVSGRYNTWRQIAFEYAWIIDQVTHPAPSGQVDADPRRVPADGDRREVAAELRA
ncbi:MAG TPA: S9 family peptidase [Propionibacteriaceae bacterium]|nr:S9 family peptidase [Propionibacteriaceae bacterium]